MATVLSGYYGIDFSPVAQQLGQFGGNLGSHTDASQAQLAEFHSFIEPILQEQIPYLQLTRGLGYQDALQAAYNEDPMLQALYGKYDVTPMRQTKDGSTYIYDPFTYGEIRTKEVKDKDFQKAVKIIGSVAVAFYAPQMLSNALGISKAAATATVAAGQTVVSGGDFEDVLKNAGLSFIGATAAEKLGNAKAAYETLAAAGPGAASLAAQALTEYNTAKLLYAAAQVGSGAVSGNLGAGVLAAFGPDLTTTALNKVGLTPELLDRAGVNQDLLVNGLVKTQVALAQGIELEDALSMGLGQYVMSGGGIAGINKDTFFEKIGEVLRDTGEAIGDLFSPNQEDIATAAKGSAFDNIGGGEAIQLPYTKEPLPEQLAASQKLAEEEYNALVGQSPKGPNQVSDWRLEKGRAVFDEEEKVFYVGPNNAIRVNFADQPNLWDFLANPAQRELTFTTIDEVIKAAPEGSAANQFMTERYGENWVGALLSVDEIKDISFGGAAPSTSAPTVTNIDLLNDPNVDLESLLASTAGQAPTIQYTAPDGASYV
jgi:hypothetical protein